MIISLFLFWIISIALALALATTPLMLGIWILIITFIIAVSVCLPLSSWFRFIVFLIYIGGLLVIFAYFIAIDPNKKLNFIDPIIIPTITLLSFYAITNKSDISQLLTFSNTNIFNLSTLYIKNNIPILIMLTLVLLLAIIIVVKIARRTEGPLRPFK